MKQIKNAVCLFAVVFFLSYGAAAQNIVFKTLDGAKIDVEAQKNKVVVMAIGASWLPLSNEQAEIVNKLAVKYTDRNDVVFYFIATDSVSARSKNYASDEDIRKFRTRNRLSVTILRDSDGAKSIRKYNIDQLPAFIILDKQGRVSGEPIQGIDPFGEIDSAEMISKRVDKLI